MIDRDVVLAADMTRAKVNELTGSQYEQAMKVALEVTLLTEEQRADIEQTVMVNLRAVAEELMEKHGESFAMIATAMLGVVCNSYVSTLASVFEEEKGLASTGPGCSAASLALATLMANATKNEDFNRMKAEAAVETAKALQKVTKH